MSGVLRRAPGLPGDWDGLVVICAGTSWDGVWFPEKHVADRLAAHAPVLYVDPPISPMTARRNPELAASMDGPRLRLLRPGLARLTPVVLPGMHRPGIYAVTEALVKRALARAVAGLGGWVRAVVVATPADLFGVCGERRKVLYATDDFVAGAGLMGIPEGRARRIEAAHAAAADTVVAISPDLAEKWERLSSRVAMIPNGCDDRMFAGTDDAPLPVDVELDPPVAGFIGHLSERIDVALLEAVAERGRSMLLVGPRQATFQIRRMDALLARPNVRWVGPKSFESLPSYLRAMDVGLTPYGDSAFNRASFPLKTLEYLAGGRGVVASDLPAIRWLDSDLIRSAPPSDPAAFADAVDEALAEPRTAALVSQRRAFAANHSWSARTADIARLLDIDMASPTPPGIEAAAP